jgi:diguanylate cyclase (GGDEF)-like protein/PAS domain S-box-containing protein
MRFPRAIGGSGATAEKDRFHIMETALAAVVDAVIAVDSDDRIVYLNPSAESITGWRFAESAGKSLGQVFFLVDAESDRVIDNPLEFASGSAARSQSHAALIDRRGLQVGIEFTAAELRGDHGRAAGAVVVFRPRRHAAEIALQNSNESLLANADELFEEKERAQVTLNSIGDAVICTNFSGRVSYLNVVAEHMTGLGQSIASDRAVDDVFRMLDPATRAKIPCPTTRAIIENRRVSLEALCRRPDNVELAVEVSAAPIHDRIGGVIGAVMVAHDVTAARELSRKLARLALHDTLTDLPNRALFSDRLVQAMATARAQGAYAALLYVDLDRFKHINDSLGHAVGDELLQTVALRLLGCVRNTDTVSRQGGDEFVVLLAELARVEDAATCADKILNALQSPYRIAEHELRVTASIGIAVFPEDADDGDALLRCAYLAMYQAKYGGRNNYKQFVRGATLGTVG